MRTVIFIPPLARSSGGLVVLYQLAERLRELGLPVAFTASAQDTPGLAEQIARGFEVLPWPESGLGPDDCYLVPEGWPNALAPGLTAKARCVVYVQNWAYLLSSLPAGFSWSRLPVSFLAVSQPVACFIRDMLRLPLLGIVRPCLDEIFLNSIPAAEKNAKALRIAWMPRKNKALGESIRQVAEALLEREEGLPPLTRLHWVEIHRKSRAEVAEELTRSHIFLCTGFPEGFALPPLEAMACGCIPVGFSGFGGWDYMREAGPGFGPGNPYPPYLALRETAWSGNGFYAPDGDALAAALALREAVLLLSEGGAKLTAVREAGRLAASAYGAESQRAELAAAWKSIQEALNE